MNQQDDTTTAEIEAFKDDPMEVVRCLAGVAEERRKMTPEQRQAEPDPLGDWSPLAQAAKRICLANGYAENGNELPGFMERAARSKLAEQEAETRVKTWIERSRKGDTIYQVMESMKKENEELRAELARLS